MIPKLGLKRLDRYLLRELAFPFLLALVGFLIFILLNLILGLREWMLDRGLSFWVVLRLLLYQLPEFLVYSIPVATVFAIFLALGRLAHDREIIAFQAGGFSLRRIVLPILVASLLLSGLSFLLSDRFVPWANSRYQETFGRLVLRRAITPKIREDTFFKDAEGRVFYVRRYDHSRGRLEGIMIYDLSGRPWPYPGLEDLHRSGRGRAYPVVVLAEEGTWQGERWLLREGVIHQYGEGGHLVRALSFQEMEIDVGGGIETLFLRGRTPREMSLGELAAQIRRLREAGLGAEGLILEYHSKIALPLAGFVFALLGAPLSLIFALRSRAAGVVLSVLLIGLFQGSMIWSQTLGRRGIISPVVGAWLPDLLFGLIGLGLFLAMDRLSRLDLRERLRRLSPLVLGIIFIASATVGLGPSSPGLAGGAEAKAEAEAEPGPGEGAGGPRFELYADSLTISEDWGELLASGSVMVSYGEARILAEELQLELLSRGRGRGRPEPDEGVGVGEGEEGSGEERWHLRAGGQVELELKGVGIAAEADELTAELSLLPQEGDLRLEWATLEGLRGEYRPLDDGEGASLRYRAQRAELEFAGGELVAMELTGEAELEFERSEELLKADRIRLVRRGGQQGQQEEGEQEEGEGRERWQLEARGGVLLEEGEGEGGREGEGGGRLTSAAVLLAELVEQEGGFLIEAVEAEEFAGQEEFINARGERHPLRYRGRRAELEFAADAGGAGEGDMSGTQLQLERLELAQGDFTTCTCSELIRREAYCISTDRLLILSDELLVATNVVLRAFGVPVFWSPLYVTPLKRERESPFFPEVGRSRTRGWYARWRLPFALGAGTRNHGLILLDYYNRYRELGAGLDLEYDLPGLESSGRLHFYKLFGVSELLELRLSDRTQLPRGVSLALTTDYRLSREPQAQAPKEQRSYRVQLAGERGGWRWTGTIAREEHLELEQKQHPSGSSESEGEGGKEPGYRALERRPELTLSRSGSLLDGLIYSVSLSWGRYRERRLGAEGFEEGTRFAGALTLSLKGLELHEGRVKLRARGGYQLALYGPGTSREVLSFAPSLDLLPLEDLQLMMSYDYRLVRGESPFAFDYEQRASRLSFKGSWQAPRPRGLGEGEGEGEGDLQASFAGSYDLERATFTPLKLSLTHRLGPSTTSLGLTYDLNRGRPQQLTLKEALTGEGWSATLSGGYSFTQGRFADLIAKLSWGEQRLGLRYDPNNFKLERINLELEAEPARGWQLMIKGEYDLERGRLAALQWGLVRSFCECWELGLFGERDRVWLQARITAFPTIGLKYSPTDKQLAFGG